eukprot:CAMPEP_0119012704 /NCGR_PEP_ID=MMETSP1176-20130426/7319_1 /TAXON_ID=265551 /ORGANISM="Synedropsis recta cf, Strain CCMP1620" /LENGTH=38 /DNA_ID= /DNA_START= /DNA_END= /DNA_ORIENTATION=
MAVIGTGERVRLLLKVVIWKCYSGLAGMVAQNNESVSL